MNWFRNLSYLRKLTFSSMLSSLFAIIAVIIIIGVVSFNSTRSEMVKNLKTTANIVGTSARAAVSFDDPDFALEILQSLHNQPDVLEAKIFIPGKDEPFAHYENSGSINGEVKTQNGQGFTIGSMQPVISRHEVVVSEPVYLDTEIIASIYLRASTKPLYSRRDLILVLSVISLLVATLLSLLIWSLTRNIWAEPFLRFSRTIRLVTKERDYSKRLKVTANDELGELIRGFNAMLEQIEAQQFQLLEQQTSLEHDVESRTHELTNANRKLINEVAERSKTEINLLKLTSAVTQAEESVIITDSEGYIEYVNPSFERITGYSELHAKGKKPSLLKSEVHEPEFFSDMWAALTHGEVYKGTFINTRPNGDTYYLEQSITSVRNTAGKITNYVATGRDITDRIKTEKTLQHMAHHDALTGLPNRTLLTDRIDHAIDRAKREGTEIAVMFIDLDGFKLANDMYGHEAGDGVLKGVASRLRSVVRTQDTVARISGDEFSVVLEDMHTVSDAGIVARKIMDSLCKPYVIGGNEVFVTASIGIAVYPIDGNDSRSMLKHADQAMYSAKKSGKARYSYYSEEENEMNTQRMQIEQQLIRAVKEKQFVLHYQPLMQTDEKSVHGVEALIRWQHPKQGIIMPDQFIPSLEDSGMINEVGAWVMEEACMQLARWKEQGHNDLLMSINVSPRQLNDQQFINNLVSALQVSGIEASSLEIEITERMFLAFDEQNVRTLNQVADLGVQIAVDDFGMGHSSLSYLSKLRINTLKIDRVFINELTRNESDAKIVSALIGLAERLSISVTAEGVETREQLQVLNNLNCKYAQGYLWARAMPPTDFESWNLSATQQMKKLSV